MLPEGSIVSNILHDEKEIMLHVSVPLVHVLLKKFYAIVLFESGVLAIRSSMNKPRIFPESLK